MYVSLTFTHLDIILILAIYDAKIHCIPHANEDSANQHRFAQDCTGPHWTAPEPAIVQTGHTKILIAVIGHWSMSRH